jgi:hypothetical protein
MQNTSKMGWLQRYIKTNKLYCAEKLFSVFNTDMKILVLQTYCPMSLLNLGVRQLPLRHWGHKGVVGYPYCGINPKGGIKLPQLWHSLQAGGIKLSPSAASELFLHINAKLFVTSRIKY